MSIGASTVFQTNTRSGMSGVLCGQTVKNVPQLLSPPACFLPVFLEFYRGTYITVTSIQERGPLSLSRGTAIVAKSVYCALSRTSSPSTMYSGSSRPTFKDEVEFVSRSCIRFLSSILAGLPKTSTIPGIANQSANNRCIQRHHKMTTVTNILTARGPTPTKHPHS